MTQPVVAPGATPSLSGWRALFQVATDPAGTFKGMGSKPPILPGYLLQMAVGGLVFALTLKMSLAAYDQQMLLTAGQPNAQQMTPEAMEVMKWVTMATIGVISLAGPWVIGLLLSFIATFMGQFQGGGVSLGSYMGMIGYARVPLALSSLLGGIYAVVTGKALDLSLAVFLAPEASPYLKGLMQMVNPFGLWYYALLATGFAALFGRPARKGLGLSVLLFVVGALLTMGSMGLGSRFAPVQ